MPIRIEKNLSNTDYHKSGEISKSKLDLIHKSIANYLMGFKKPTLALTTGQAFHTAWLERECFEKEFYVQESIGLKKDFVAEYLDTNKGCKKKDADSAWEEKKKEQELENAEHEGKTILTAAQYLTIQRMIDSLVKYPRSKSLFQEGEPEVSLFWDELDIPCKARPDWVVNKGEILVDIKTTMDASPEGFARSVLKYRYHVQAAWYIKAATVCYGVKPDDFIFLAVENHPPFNVAAYHLGQDSLDEGWMLATQDLRKYKAWESDPESACTGYTDEIVQINIPSYGFTQF